MFLRIAGVTGGCSEPGYEGCIEVLAWSWGASNSIGSASVPLRVRQAKLAEKRALLAAVGLDEHGNKLPKKKADKKKAADGGADAEMEQEEDAEEEEESHEETRAKMAAALANFDEDGSYAPFSNSEVVREKGRANCQDISLTKYVDLSSAALMSMVLGGQKGQGVDAELLILRRRRKPQTDEQKEAEKAKAEAKKNKEKKGGDDDEEEEDDEEDDEDDNTEYVPYITWQFFSTFITSVSTGGSGGEDRLTENVTLHFDGFTYKVVDWNKKSAAQRKQKKEKKLQDKQAAAGSSAAAAAAAAPASSAASSSSSSSVAARASEPETFERSIIFDQLRGTVGVYESEVRAEINKDDRLHPVTQIIMGYSA
jgi:type VI protein secretion system component Hcp